MSLSHDPLPRSGDEGNDRAYWEPTSAFLKYAIATLFGGDIGHPVEDLVNYRHTRIAHPDFVSIGKT